MPSIRSGRSGRARTSGAQSRARVVAVLGLVVMLAATAACGSTNTRATSSDRSASAEGDSDSGGSSSAHKTPSASRHSSTTLDPRGEAEGLHCGLPTAGPPSPPPGQTPPSTAFPEPINDFPLKATLKPARGDPGDQFKVSVTAGRPGALIVVFAVWSDGKDHDVRRADFADLTGHAEFQLKVPAGIPPGQARIVVSANFTVGDHTETALIRELYIVTGPGCP